MAELIQNTRLTGTRISVFHSVFGVIFSYIVDAKGTIVRNPSEYVELTPDRILEELAKFGFFVEYDPKAHLPEPQLEYLRTLNNLGFDKIRLLRVYEIVNMEQQAEIYIVAFQASPLPYWLNNDYSARRAEFRDALEKGYATNLSAISQTKDYNWSWLYGFVANIEDVLNENAEEL